MSGEITKLKIRHGERELTVNGRIALTLNKLVVAGDRGITPLDFPTGCRVSHYIFKLRGEGIPIKTLSEKHGGQFAGHHARYVLRSPVAVLETERRP